MPTGAAHEVVAGRRAASPDSRSQQHRYRTSPPCTNRASVACAEEQGYLTASLAQERQRREDEQARQQKELGLQKRAASRLRMLAGSLALFLLVALALSLFAFDRQGAAVTSAATAVANGAVANAQRATAVANEAVADNARATTAVNLARADAQTSRQVRLFVGHTDWVRSVAFSPDGNEVLTGSADTTARLWDAQTGQELRCVASHQATRQLSRVTRRIVDPTMQIMADITALR